MNAGCADPLRMRAIPERLRGVFTTKHYTNTRLPLPLQKFSQWPKHNCIADNSLQLSIQKFTIQTNDTQPTRQT